MRGEWQKQVNNVVRGTYALVLRLDFETRVLVGCLGAHVFAPGYYVYIGSAMNGLTQRLARHLKAGKKMRWHVDYLRERAEAVDVWYVVSEQASECELNEAVSAMTGAIQSVKGFGSSDCRCRSHLVYFQRLPDFGTLRRKKAGAGLKRLSLSGAFDLERL